MDDGSPLRYLLWILAFLIGSAFFSGAEISYSSVSKIRMTTLADGGDRRAKRVLVILDSFDRALATLLVGNNIMNIGCATVSTVMVTQLWGVGAVGYSTFITTAVIFILGEILPKTFAKTFNEGFAMAISGFTLRRRAAPGLGGSCGGLLRWRAPRSAISSQSRCAGRRRSRRSRRTN